MYYGKFSVRIPEGNEVADGYVKMAHGTQYRLVLRNSNDVRCDALVRIDGEEVGVFRINKYSSVTIERPSDDESRFTFFRANSREGRQGELDRGNPDLGLVSVTFKPEIRPRPVVVRQRYISDEPFVKGFTLSANDGVEEVYSNSGFMNAYRSAPENVSAGGTALTGHSDQKFYSVRELDYDYDAFVTIHLRLVCDELAGIKPLGRRSTPVPPPIG